MLQLDRLQAATDQQLALGGFDVLVKRAVEAPAHIGLHGVVGPQLKLQVCQHGDLTLQHLQGLQLDFFQLQFTIHQRRVQRQRLYRVGGAGEVDDGVGQPHIVELQAYRKRQYALKGILRCGGRLRIGLSGLPVHPQSADVQGLQVELTVQ